MGIRFYCPECGRRMNVKSFLAGKRGICPHCDARWEVPLESEIPEGAPKMRPAENGAPAQAVATSSASTATAKTNAEVDDHDTTAFESVAPVVVDPIAASPDAVWYVRPASGGEFGPAKGDVMRRWMEEGRVGADSMVWCEGWPEWQVAGPIFPTLAPVAAQPAADPVEEAKIQVATEPKSLANLEAIQKKTSDLNGRAARQRTAGSGKSIAAVVILGLMIVALFVVLLVVVNS